MSLPNQVALVTGCSEGGIGFHICQNLAARKITVYATSRSLSSTEKLDHPLIKRLILDVTSDSDVQRVVETIMEQEGHIDLLINNAGVFAPGEQRIVSARKPCAFPGPVIDWTTERMQDVFDTNVFSILRLTRTIVPHMAKRSKGTVVNIGSITGQYPSPWTGIYSSSKAAVRALTEVLTMECKPFNIHVMLVEPSAVASDIMNKFPDLSTSLPVTSLYHAFLHNIIQRVHASKNSGSAMSGEDFAEEIITKALRSKPPRYVLTGGLAWFFRMWGYLPRSWYLWDTWRRFSKPEQKIKSEPIDSW
ncbi:NAD-P-binding protein [Mycena crocata]|nr:NAD-P-binding protein [Mycena crocata]